MERGFKIASNNFMKINLVGFILSLIAGWINAVGVSLFLSESPAFLSGRGLMLVYSVLIKDIKVFVGIMMVVVSFIIGAALSAFITRYKGLSYGLFLSGILISIAAIPFSLRNLVLDTILISMALGAQNAATSLTSLNRTTHLTGPATDIGINIARKNWRLVIFWTLRWISFPIGAAIGFVLVEMYYQNIISLSATLFLPAILILSLSVIQKKFLHIPLLKSADNKNKRELY